MKIIKRFIIIIQVGNKNSKLKILQFSRKFSWTGKVENA